MVAPLTRSTSAEVPFETGPTPERDQDAPYERIAADDRPAEAQVPIPPRGHGCNVGRHRKFKPAALAYELSVVDGQRTLVDPYVLAACDDHRRELARIIRERSERFARGGLEARAWPIT